MRTLITILACLISIIGNSQRTNHMVGTTFVPSLYQSTSTLVLAQKLEYGVEYSTGWNVHGGIGFLSRRSDTDYKGSYFSSNGIIGSLSLTRRLTTTQCVISPVGGISLGSALYNSKPISSLPSHIDSKQIPMPEDAFLKLRFFAKVKMQLDLNLGNVIFRAGPTYTFYETRNYGPNRLQSDIMSGYGFEFGLYFAFNKRHVFQGIYIPSRGKI